MIVTKVKQNRYNNNNIDIFLDGEFAFQVSEEEYIMLNLYEKNNVSNKGIKEIKEKIIYNRVKKKAFSYISVKFRTKKDVENTLAKIVNDKEMIDKAIASLEGYGYINDKLYARKFIYDRLKLKPKSRNMLKKELIEKGIDEMTADSVLNELLQDEYEIVLNLTKKKLKDGDINNPKTFKKIYSFLKYRGFNHEIIMKVMRKSGKVSNMF